MWGNRAQCQRGYILLPVVLAITLIAVIAFMMNREGTMNTNRAAGLSEVAEAQYLAEAGIKHAHWLTQQNNCIGDLTIPTTALGSHRYTAAVGSPATTTTQTFSPAVDTFINEAAPSSSFGGDAELHVENVASGNRRTMYRFDLSSIATGTRVASASLRLYVIANDNQGEVNIHSITTAWTEGSATWNTMSTKFDKQVFGSISPQANAGVWVSVNLTGLAQSWINDAATNHGIMLLATSNNIASRYTSKEYGNTSLRPYLQLTTADTAVSPLGIKAAGTTVGGVTRTMSRSVVKAYQVPNPLTLQPDATEGKDTLLNQGAPNWNQGITPWLWVQHTGGGSGDHSLLQFDLSSIPVHSKIENASLWLYKWTSGAGGTIALHRVTSDWAEGTQDHTTGPGATWNDRDTGVPWISPGGDYDPSPVDVSNLNAGAAAWYRWDITPLVQGWVSGSYDNQGMILVAQTAETDLAFSSSDTANASEHPKLTITYACECDRPCLAPQGAGNILMVVSNFFAMTNDELTKKSLFESWGYTVNLISQGDVYWAFDGLTPFNDVVFVSEGVNATTSGMAPKLAATSLGLVSEEGRLNDELGIASGFAWPVGASINVTDTSHYITQVFPNGALSIYQGGMEGLTVSGTQAPDLQTLANWGTAGALVVLEQGAQLDGGGTAAGRRVMLPLGREADFNWNYLNNNGRLIVQRAIEWAKGAVTSSQVILLVVLDAANPTAQDAAKKALIESWGYTVTMIEATESQANLDAVVAVSDAVYISEEIHSSDLGTKLTNAAIGIVSEEGYINDELGLSSTRGSYVDDSIEITDNANYITSPFSLGALNITTSNQDLQTLGGTLAPGLIDFSDQPTTTTATLGVIEAGSLLWGGGTAAARRVHLPWGPNDFDFTTLNSDGEILMRRALEWVLGAGPILVPNPIAHWKLDDGSGPVAVDSIGGFDGTLAGDPTWGTGTIDGALDFDGTGDRIDVGSVFTGGSPQISVSAWVFKRDSGDDRVICKSSGPATNNHIFSLGVVDTTIRVRLQTTDNGGTDDYDAGTISLNQWTHLAFTYDGAALRIYRDGTETGVFAVSGDMIGSSLPIAIGNINATQDRYWNGLLDDVRIYDHALTPVEITTLASSGSGGNFRDEFNTDAFNNNNGTLTWGGDWIEVDGDGAGPTAGNAQISGGRMNLDDRPNTGGDPSLAREVDLSSYASATLSFSFEITEQVDSSDSVVVEISDNGGTNWAELEDFTGISSATTDTRSYDISTYMSANTQIRFRVNARYGGANEKFSVDDLDIAVTGGS